MLRLLVWCSGCNGKMITGHEGDQLQPKIERESPVECVSIVHETKQKVMQSHDTVTRPCQKTKTNQTSYGKASTRTYGPRPTSGHSSCAPCPYRISHISSRSQPALASGTAARAYPSPAPIPHLHDGTATRAHLLWLQMRAAEASAGLRHQHMNHCGTPVASVDNGLQHKIYF
jgi:hypothetical protein